MLCHHLGFLDSKKQKTKNSPVDEKTPANITLNQSRKIFSYHERKTWNTRRRKQKINLTSHINDVQFSKALRVDRRFGWTSLIKIKI